MHVKNEKTLTKVFTAFRNKCQSIMTLNMHIILCFNGVSLLFNNAVYLNILFCKYLVLRLL